MLLPEAPKPAAKIDALTAQLQADVAHTSKQAHGIMHGACTCVGESNWWLRGDSAQQHPGSHWLIAIAAGLSTAAVIVNSTFKFEQRTRAHLNHLRRCELLLGQLTYESTELGVVHKEWIASRRIRDEEWPNPTPLPLQLGK